MFSFFKRNYLIFLLTFLLTLLGSLYWTKQQTASFHTTIFTTIGNQSDSSSEENEQASTYFGETLMGWFRNPAFLNKIYREAGTEGSLSAHKQERQNLIIDIDASAKSENIKLADATLVILDDEISQFNTKTGDSFTLLNLGKTNYENPLKNTVFILAVLIGGMVLVFFMLISVESLRGIISLPIQIGNIFKKEIQLSVNLKNTSDLEHLSTLCLNAKKPIIFAGVDFDHSDFTVQTSIKASEIEKNLILVDGDLKAKKLHHNLGLSEMMKNLKGLTDRVNKEEKLSQFIHKTLDGNINFLAAGNGPSIILEDIAEQLQAHKTIIIHTILPQNFPILSLEDFELFLFVKPGKSKIKTLEQIKVLGIQDLKIFIV